ncbi:cholinephosphotransferase, putative [Entamoeba invadens IP1]|uniref:Cholinephosphotransferase, putative n=1 Tax=Entamoeba invadens IP1 TaxID=370355 RepID=A0A0A1U0V5_ENTIV|nr:cholinephosphotransferase, putative [Entamoeba invadens IP1]ELP87512.1 cholinephosphotransferase, putative [Entamoeba invadens IP1]|eukprot:XP_004254283.1 cholinephosphotransferase, putative [Entamoeba invadens IP1]
MYTFDDDIYFTKEDTEKLHQHRYNCTDNSILNKYILNKYVYQPILKYLIPKWIAPNIISIFGLVFCVLTLPVNYSNVFGRFEYLVTAFLVMLYQLFDSLDGMQARYTKSSSALGELVDHGIDALTSGILLLLLSLQCGMTQQERCVLLVVGYFVFYVTHYTSYFTEHMEFGYILNPTEALVTLSIFMICRTIFGITSDVFKSYKVGSFSINFIIVCVIATLALIYIVIELSKIIRYDGLFNVMISYIVISLSSVLILLSQSNSIILDQTKVFIAILFLAHYNQLFIAHAILQIEHPKIGYFYSTVIIMAIIIFINISGYNMIGGTLYENDSYASVIFVFVTLTFTCVGEVSLVLNCFCVFSRVLRIHPFTV